MDKDYKEFKNINIFKMPKQDINKSSNNSNQNNDKIQETLEKVNFQNLIQNLKSNELLHCHLFMKPYWQVCVIGVYETEQALQKFRKEHPGYLKSIYIAKLNTGFEKLLESNYVNPNDLYINSDQSMFKLLKMKNPGLLSCLGMCYKNFNTNLKNKLDKYSNKVKVDTQIKIKAFSILDNLLGGSILINSKGKIRKDDWHNGGKRESLLICRYDQKISHVFVIVK